MLRLEDHFWNREVGDFSGWETVVGMMKDGKHVSKQYIESLKQRAQLEEAFGKNLLRLAKSIPPPLDSSPFSSAWLSYRQQTESTAQSHLTAARRLAEEAQAFSDAALGPGSGSSTSSSSSSTASATAAATTTTSSAERRAQEEAVRQWQQKLKVETRRSAEAKALYEKRCREEIACNHFYHQEMARFGKTSKEAEKAKTKLEKSQLTQKASEAAYKSAVEEAEYTRRQWEEKTRDALSNFQAQEENRTSVMLESMWKVSNIVSSRCVEDDEAMEELRMDMERCLETDFLDTFIRENATGVQKPKEIWYEPQPTSTSVGLGHASSAPTAASISPSISSSSTTRDMTANAAMGSPSPPKPPRLIHYASRSVEDWDRLAKRGGSYPHVDSVDNIEYFNLPDPCGTSSLSTGNTTALFGSAENSGNESSSSSSDMFWTLDSLIRR